MCGPGTILDQNNKCIPDPDGIPICHKPGTPAEKTKLVPLSALPGHAGHGDTIGPCT